MWMIQRCVRDAGAVHAVPLAGKSTGLLAWAPPSSTTPLPLLWQLLSALGSNTLSTAYFKLQVSEQQCKQRVLAPAATWRHRTGASREDQASCQAHCLAAAWVHPSCLRCLHKAAASKKTALPGVRPALRQSLVRFLLPPAACSCRCRQVPQVSAGRPASLP